MPFTSTLTEETNGLSRMVLSDQVKQYILDCIERGEYKPGERLVESQLARQLRTSQAPVREAIRDLVSIGFLEREPHRGAIVRLLTDEDLHEIYIVRAPLDALAAEQAAPETPRACQPRSVPLRVFQNPEGEFHLLAGIEPCQPS